MSNRRRKTPTTWYVLFEWPGDDFGNLAPVLSRLFHCACFLKSPPLTVLWEEWRAIFSIPRRSTSSPARGAERVLSWTILSGSWNGTQPVGKENVLWCLMVRPRFSLPMDSIMSVLFGGKFSLVAAEQNNDKAHETRQTRSTADRSTPILYCTYMCLQRATVPFIFNVTLSFWLKLSK